MDTCRTDEKEKRDVKYPLDEWISVLDTLLAEQDIPLEIRIHPRTREILADDQLYATMNTALELQLKRYAELLKEKKGETQAAVVRDLYPLLGLTLQVVFEYVNGNIKREEFVYFDWQLRGVACSFMRNREKSWRSGWIPFYIPSSVEVPMKLLCNWPRIMERFEFLLRMIEVVLKRERSKGA